MSSANWKKIEELVEEIVQMQHAKVLKMGQSIVPQLTEDDLLQPNDFLQLEHNPIFRYEEGILSGIQTVQTALSALKRDGMR